MRRLPKLLLVPALTFVSLSISNAAEYVFELDPERSSISASAVLAEAGLPSEVQGPGSDMTTYFGTVTVDLDDLMNPGSIDFLSAEIAAESSGEWLPEIGGGIPGDPGDPQIADFGFLFSVPDGFIFASVRDSVITMTTDEPLPVVDGMFPSTEHVETTAGAYEVNISSPSLGGDDVILVDLGEAPAVDDNEASPGSIVTENGLTTLTMPLDLTFSDNGLDFFYVGELVGTFGELMATRLPGDANEDGRVDAADLNAVGLNWQMGGKSWSEGDFNEDGFVDAADLNIVGLNWQATAAAAPAAVPEPSSAFGLVLALFCGLGLRRRT